MFTKVLIAEDFDGFNTGISTKLKELGFTTIDQVQYCDDAYLKIRRAIQDNKPYDLLITDLSFVEDYREQQYKSGEALIQALREKNITIPIIVYSIEDRIEKVRILLSYNINGYVCKSRSSLQELSEAIQHIYNHKEEPYVSTKVAYAKKKSENTDITPYDIQLIELLSKGYSQRDVSTHFLENNISPSSVSSIEKRINKLKDLFRANNLAHLTALAKDQGFI